jgi:hypothetical protein
MSIGASGAKAGRWLQNFLESPKTPPQQRFGRLLYLIALLDFELSPFSLSRLEARAHQLAESQAAEHGRRMLQDAVPQLKQLVQLWHDARTHELDEASLWIYRDELERLGWEETARNLGHHR